MVSTDDPSLGGDTLIGRGVTDCPPRRSDSRKPGAARGRAAREELSELAGVSVDYVVRLEQGRAPTPSAQIVSALARALRLSRDQRTTFTGWPGCSRPGTPRSRPHPAGHAAHPDPPGRNATAVFAADWRLIWWKRGWAALIGDPSSARPRGPQPGAVPFPVAADHDHLARWPIPSQDGETTDRAIVADLRRASGRYPNDHRLTALIRRLSPATALRRLWREGAVGRHAEDRRHPHPEIGDITVDCDVLNDGDTDLKIVIYTAPAGTEDDEPHLARVTGAVPPAAPSGSGSGQDQR